jgi:hypothetical protein
VQEHGETDTRIAETGDLSLSRLSGDGGRPGRPRVREHGIELSRPTPHVQRAHVGEEGAVRRQLGVPIGAEESNETSPWECP